MALTTVAPPERTEHLIYTILPLSFGLWIIVLVTPSDPLYALAIISAISSIGTLLLYEVALDEYLVKAWYRFRCGSGNEDQKRRILLLALLMRTWETELTDMDWSKDYLKTQVDSAASVVISSPHVRRRLWRIRATGYLFLALPFLFNAATKTLGLFVGNYHVSLTTSGLTWVLILLTNISYYWFGLLILSYGILTFVHYLRHKNLRSNIKCLAEFRNLQTLFAIENIRRKQQGLSTHKPGRLSLSYDEIGNELSVLEELLSESNWTVFINRWRRVSDRMYTETEQDVADFGVFDLVDPWAQIILINNKTIYGEFETKARTERETRKMGWLSYYLSKMNENESPFFLIDKNYWSVKVGKLAVWLRDEVKEGIEKLKKPDTLIEKLEGESDHNGILSRGLLYAITISNGKSAKYNDAVEQGLMALRTQFSKNIEPIFTLSKVVGPFLGFIIDDEVCQSINVWKTTSAEDVEKIHQHINPQDTRWKEALLRYLKHADSQKMYEILEKSCMTSYLPDPKLAKAILKKKKDLLEKDELRILIEEMQKMKLL